MKAIHPFRAPKLAMLGALGLAVAQPALAHTGHDSTSLFAGLAHPFGLDHLLAMVAVGSWSALALPAGRRWAGPALFIGALVAGAWMGAFAGRAGLPMPWIEQGVAISVALFGALLLSHRLSAAAGIAIVAAGALLHGVAHGAEAPASGFTGYAAGFVATTLALHLAGVKLGIALHEASGRAWARWSSRALAALVGSAGVAMLAARI